MAAQIGCEAIKITAESNAATVDLHGYDLIFVGTGLYAGTPNEDIAKYLKNLKLKPKTVCSFYHVGWRSQKRQNGADETPNAPGG